MEPLFPAKVVLTEPDHKYHDSAGQEYMSFSSVYEFVCERFDAKKIAYFAGGKNEEGMIAKLNEWDKKREVGVRLDKALTEYAKTGRTDEQDLLDAVKTILGTYAPHTAEQVVVYNEQYRTAGTADKISFTSNRKDSKFIVSDFKCYEKFDLHESRGWLKAPFEHLPKSKFIQISFQLSYYAFHFEQLTGKKCNGMFIHLIDPTTIGGEIREQKIHVPYLKNDILILLETFKDQIKEKLSNKNEFVI
jgi:hypothetical protein